MRAGDDFGAFGNAGDFIDVERRGVRQQQRAWFHYRVELAEHRLLGGHFLKNGFDCDISVGNIGIVQHRGDAGQTGVHVVLAKAAALHRRRIIIPNALHAAIQGLLRGFQDFHRNAEISEAHGDAAAHGAGADHGCRADFLDRGVGGNAGDILGFALAEESVPQAARFVGVFQFAEQVTLARQALQERQRGGRLNRQNAVIRCFLIAGAARDGFALGVENLRIDAGDAAVAAADLRQRANIGNALGHRDGGGQQIAIHNLIENTEAFRFIRRHVAARGDHVERDLHARQARQALGAPAARQNADQYFRQPDLGGAHRDAIIAAHRGFEPATQRIAMNGGHNRLGAGIELVGRAVPDRRPDAAFAELANIRAGDEAASGTDEHHGLHRGVSMGFFKARSDAFRHARAQRIHRRVVDGDDPDAVLDVQGDKIFRHSFLRAVWLRGS